MRGKIVKSFALFLLTIMCTVFCFACADASEAFVVEGEPTFTCVYNEETNVYDVAIDGLAKNQGKKEWSSVCLTYALYDENGYMVGIAQAYITYVGAQGTWRFSATGTADYPTISVELIEIGGYEK